MDQPHRDIRFTTTEDGVGIAFWEIGEGQPIVILNNFALSHAELEWTVPSLASFYMDLARRYRVIRYDPRGMGLSEEPPGGWEAVSPSGAQLGMSTHGMGLDITAVNAALGLDSFTLMGNIIQGPVAIEYAAKHAEVTGLILCDSCATVSTSFLGPVLRTQAELNLIEAGTNRPVSTVFWERMVPPDEVEQTVNLVLGAARSWVGQSNSPTLAQLEWDAEALLGEISVPTLIISSRTDIVDTLPDARHLAAAITGSQLRVVDGKGAPYFSDRAAIVEAIDALLKPEQDTLEDVPPGFRTVVFTDIVESTEFVRRVGDEKGRAAIRDLEQQVASLAAEHGGRVVKNLGDGSLVSGSWTGAN